MQHKRRKKLDYNFQRMCFFWGTLAICLILQKIFPFRKIPLVKIRFLINISLHLLNTFLVYIAVPFSLAQISQFSMTHNWDLLSLSNFPYWSQLLVLLFLFDMTIYWQHRFFHRIPILWRLHAVHHSDPELSTSSAVRFHPIEIILSFLIKAALVVLFAPPTEFIFIFETTLNSSALFHHTNIMLPSKLDQLLRRIIITPSIHLVHHSTYQPETDSNFGFFLSIWDVVFGTRTTKKRSHLEEMKIGLDEYNQINTENFISLLKAPFLIKFKKN